MTSQSIWGYAAKAKGQSLEPFEYPAPYLQEHEVRVSISHCGVCHTDLQAIDDYYGITDFPFIPGHEIIGTISDVGPGVSDLALGQRVGIGWQARSCGKCEWCLKGETQLCMEIEDTTVMVPYGGFSTAVVADHRFVYPLPEGLPLEHGSVLMCAGLTVYTALRNHLPDPTQQVAILGLGGLGHLAVQFAAAMGCKTTVISSTPEKEAEAFEFGAASFVCSRDPVAMRAIRYGLDVVYCTANHGIEWGALLSAMKKRGKVVLVGFPDLEFNSTNLVAHELTITGSLIGKPPMMREMLAFARKHQITPKVELMPMSEVNVALEKVKLNQVRYRIVLTNPPAH